MTNTYTIPAIAKDELQKKLEKLAKKANAYGNHLNWSFSELMRSVMNYGRINKMNCGQDIKG